MNKQMNALDLFCGAGGASLGIKNAGLDLVAAVDQDEQALQTHNENLPTPIVKHDLSDVDPSVLPTQEIGYIHGSPPCKGFSTANDQREESDPRNALVFDFVDWVAKLQPKVVSMENVTGMLSITTEFMDHVKAAYRDAGYKVKYQTLNAANYGVPQTRERVYTVGIREDVETPSRWFPQPTHSKGGTQTLTGKRLSPWVSVQEAIGNLPRIGDVDSHKSQGRTSPAAWRGEDQPSHTVTGSGNNVVNHRHPGQSDFTTVYKDFDTANIVTEECAPAKTITGKVTNSPWHYNHRPKDVEEGECRRLTVRECARLQSFPDWFVFTGSSTRQYLQVGNAVPPKLQEAVASHLQELA